jgi:hypothetical protein
MIKGKNSENEDPKETELSYKIKPEPSSSKKRNTLSLPNCNGPNKKWLMNANPTTPN